MGSAAGNAASPPQGSAGEVLLAALKLGLTCFGGPIAHLGYFERTYVRALGWLSSEQFAQLVALCQLLPGPTSSQVGFLIGLKRAGWLGALAAWTGFTLPSALIMYGFAVLAPASAGPRMQAVLAGLMWTAVAVVAQALWNMARSLTPDLPRRAIAVAAFALLAFRQTGLMQLAVLVAGAIAGSVACRAVQRPSFPAPMRASTRAAWLAVGLFLLFLTGLSGAALWQLHGPAALANIFYRSGAFVFGGGHVVLPLLQQALVPAGWMSDERFLAGYGLAQAMPGPLFSVAAYLGAICAPAHQSLGWAVLALGAIFLPGLSLAAAGLSLSARLATDRLTAAVLAGLNASVVGLLAAALCNPVLLSAVHGFLDALVVIVAFVLLQGLRQPPIIIAALCVAASVGRTLAYT